VPGSWRRPEGEESGQEGGSRDLEGGPHDGVPDQIECSGQDCRSPAGPAGKGRGKAVEMAARA
jgi:hypothetical protein